MYKIFDFLIFKIVFDYDFTSREEQCMTVLSLQVVTANQSQHLPQFAIEPNKDNFFKGLLVKPNVAAIS